MLKTIEVYNKKFTYDTDQADAVIAKYNIDRLNETICNNEFCETEKTECKDIIYFFDNGELIYGDVDELTNDREYTFFGTDDEFKYGDYHNCEGILLRNSKNNFALEPESEDEIRNCDYDFLYEDFEYHLINNISLVLEETIKQEESIEVDGITYHYNTAQANKKIRRFNELSYEASLVSKSYILAYDPENEEFTILNSYDSDYACLDNDNYFINNTYGTLRPTALHYEFGDQEGSFENMLYNAISEYHQEIGITKRVDKSIDL